MSEASAIEWTDATWNPTRGCTKISPGCKHCYAETFAERWRGVEGHAYEQGFDPRLAPSMLAKPIGWKRPRRIFVNSMSDLFMEDVSDEYIDSVFGVMWACRWLGRACVEGHVFQVLTKRAERLPWYFSKDRRRAWAEAAVEYGGGLDPDGLHDSIAFAEGPHPRIHLGVSVEDRKYGLPRIEPLRRTPAAVRFLSVEPLLEDIGPIDLSGIHWVIVGGESGLGARPMQPEWVRSVRDQCIDQRVPFFFKQWGGVQKKKHGRELDGRTWDEFPKLEGGRS